jgi:hypothetical protein
MNFTEAMDKYNLPDLPWSVADDDSQARMLVLTFAHSDERVKLASCVSLRDAKAYCSRPDTSGDGWAVVFAPSGSAFA